MHSSSSVSVRARPARRAWWRGATLALVVVALAAMSASAALARDVGEDPRVQRAQEEAERARAEEEAARERAESARAGLDAARALVAETSAELDEIAAAYEVANGHYERLLAERDTEEAAIADAQQRSVDAREEFGRRVSRLYRLGPLELRLSDVVLGSGDPATALQRAQLVGRIAAGGAGGIADAERFVARTTDTARQHEIVTVGTAGAAADLREASDELGVAVASAQRRAADATAALRAAEDAREEASGAVADAATRLESEAAAAERRAALVADVGEGGYRLPPTDGMFCPIGSPHGFVDSWHAPRSGGRQHQGVDMFAAHGMPLYAATDGVVRVSTSRLGGLSVHLTADGGDRFYYAHLSAVLVESGQRVAAGEVVGLNGDSGNARGTPPHLHLQYHPGGGAAVNPTPLATALCRQ